VAVCLIVNVPGATLEQYDQVREGIGDPLGEGQISHVAGQTDDGMCVVDVWESREHFDRFLQERLGEQFGRAGLSQPQITEFEVHSSESRG
jgi:heme-degrading monooxygenase HmoA